MNRIFVVNEKNQLHIVEINAIFFLRKKQQKKKEIGTGACVQNVKLFFLCHIWGRMLETCLFLARKVL